MSRRVDQLVVAGILYDHPLNRLTWPECLELADKILDALEGDR